MTHPLSNVSPVDAAIGSGIQAMLELFHSELSSLKFPDVDQAVLDEGTARVLAQAEAVAAAEAALVAAREALADAQEALLGKCQRALAYARVYAEEDRELSRKLEMISLPRARAKVAVSGQGGSEPAEARPGRRGRRSTPASGPLFLESATGSAAELSGAAGAPGAVICAA
jgi:hypothetical protein